MARSHQQRDEGHEEEKKQDPNGTSPESKRLSDLEARAVDRAKATADAAFRPSASILNAKSPTALLEQVDGPSLETYEGKESLYVGRTVPVAAGGTLQIPIQVTTPGSVVEYVVEVHAYDIQFGITAERDEGITVVKESSKVDDSVTQKFLVGTVPCLIRFQFDNDYSWFREKQVSYKITVTPPSRESLATGRRRRAKSCLKTVVEDLEQAQSRLTNAMQQKQKLKTHIAKLRQELQQQQKALEVAEKEEIWLKERLDLRMEQEKLLQERLQRGWDDEAALSK